MCLWLELLYAWGMFLLGVAKEMMRDNQTVAYPQPFTLKPGVTGAGLIITIITHQAVGDIGRVARTGLYLARVQ